MGSNLERPLTIPAARAGHHPASYGLRSTLAGIIVNLCLAALKAIAGVTGHSYALIADAIESLTDVFSSLIVYVGLRVAMRPPDANHPYGHGKAEPMASAMVSAGLLFAAGAIAYKSVHEIRTPHMMPAPFTLLVLPIVVIAKEAMFRFVNRVGNSIGSGAVKTDAWHHRSDALTSALAFIGISIALIGGKGWEGAGRLGRSLCIRCDRCERIPAAAPRRFRAWGRPPRNPPSRRDQARRNLGTRRNQH